MNYLKMKMKKIAYHSALNMNMEMVILTYALALQFLNNGISGNKNDKFCDFEIPHVVLLDNSLITTIMKNNIAANQFPEPDKNKTIHDFDKYSENEILGYLYKKYGIPRVEFMTPEERSAYQLAASTYRPEKVC